MGLRHALNQAVASLADISTRRHDQLQELGDDDHTIYPTAAAFFTRMATAFVDASTAVAANTESIVTIGAGANAARFYLVAMRNGGVGRLFPGAKVSGAEVVEAEPTWWLSTPSAGGNDEIILINGTAASVTYVHKAQRFTGT